MCEQPQNLLANFMQIEKTRKQSEKWSVKVSDDDIVIHVVIIDQMCEQDWFSKDTMTKWEETNDNSKTWTKCQQFFKEAYMARKDTLRQNKAHRKASTRS